MNNKLCWLLGATAATVLAGSASAHHSFAMFDQSKTATIQGTVKEFQWTNPHVWIEVMVQGPDGMKQYSIETRNVRQMKHGGWSFNTLKPGDKVTMVMNPLRSGAAGGMMVTATVPDGRTLKPF